MDTPPVELLLCVCATAVATTLAIVGRVRGPLWLHHLGKPLILAAPLAAAIWLPSVLSPGARPWLAVALVFGWGGDVALMFGRRGFIVGLVSFLLGHIAYLVCFSVELAWTWASLPWLLAIGPFAYLGLRGVLQHLGRLKVPVLLYAAVLAGVAWRLLVRFERIDQIGTTAWMVGLVGGALFVLGDSLLVRRRFAKAPIPYWLELGAYAASQVAIVGGTLLL